MTYWQNSFSLFNKSHNFLKFPLTGFRSLVNGSLYDQGLRGEVWTNSINETDSKIISFSSNYTSLGYDYRAIGLPVRCIEGN